MFLDDIEHRDQPVKLSDFGDRQRHIIPAGLISIHERRRFSRNIVHVVLER